MSNFTFLITAFNPGDFISIALQSVLNQTYDDFSVLYIDDNSTDDSLRLVEKINDPRVKIIRNSEKKGLVPCLNMGIDLITTKYIIRFDADDILLPNFLRSKVQHLEEDIILLGENILITDADLNIHSKTSFPSTDAHIKRRLLSLLNNINQPGVLLDRQSVIKAGYYRGVKAAEDYDLWIRMIRLGRFKNINTFQLLYRVTGQSLTTATFDHIAKSNILALSNHQPGILETRAARLYVFLYRKYNHQRGVSLKKLAYYPLFHLYRICYAFNLVKKYFKV